MNYREKMREQLMKYPYGEYYMLKPNQPKDILRLLDEMDSADNFIKNDFLKKEQQIEQLNKQVVIMEKYLELIHDLGYDYDGFDKANDLKGLIDELVRYASLGRVCNTTEPMFVHQGKDYNILMKEIKEGNNGN